MSVNEVPFIDLTREFRKFDDEIMDAIGSVLQGGKLVLSEHVENFENEFSSYVDQNYGVGVNSGTDALYLALKTIGVEDAEVILPSHAHVSAADAVVRNGGQPVFVDIDPQTYTIDSSKIKKHINKNTAVIIPVHMYGHPADMEAIMEIADEYDVSVVEDASQAHGAKYQGRPVGSFGDIACFSLYPTKNLGAYGDAGILVTSNKLFKNKLEKLREYGSVDKYTYESIGINSRLDELQAAILRFKLKHLDQFNQKRYGHAQLYNDLLDDGITPKVAEEVKHVFHLYVIRSNKREELKKYLKERGIQTIVHYPKPIHEQPSYTDVPAQSELTVTENIVNEILSIPLYPLIKESEIKYVSDAINNFNHE